MRLELSDEQAEIRALFDTIFDKEVSPERVRRAEPLGFDRELWNLLAQSGAVSIALPEHADGSGYGVLESALIAELAGRSLAPVPFVEAVVAARLIASVDPALGSELAGGAALATIALRPFHAGRATAVPAGAVADYVVGLDDDRLVLARQDGSGVHEMNIGGLPLGTCPMNDVVAELAAGPQARSLLDRACDEWRCLTAATVAGAGARTVEIAVAYANEREQFGRPIGSFQAIAHGLADAATDLAGARLLVREAAWTLDGSPAAAPARSRMALVFAAAAANRAARRALHDHGGYGFMLEYDIQLYYRRIRSWPMPIGSQHSELAALADALYGPIEEHR